MPIQALEATEALEGDLRLVEGGAQAACHAALAQYDLEGEEYVMFHGSQAYVPRLVQANVPSQQPPMKGLKYSTKEAGGLTSWRRGLCALRDADATRGGCS